VEEDDTLLLPHAGLAVLLCAKPTEGQHIKYSQLSIYTPFSPQPTATVEKQNLVCASFFS